MLNFLIKWSLKNRLFVIIIALIVFISGGYFSFKLPIDVFPDLNKPTVTIMTEAGGLTPEEVENLVTFPIETLINGITGVERVRSQSGIGLSVIYVEFKWGSDIYLDRQLITEKLNLARDQLPKSVTPVIAPISSIMGEIMLLSVKSKSGKTSPMDLRSISDWVIRPNLLTISGVSQVTAIGGDVKQYQILIDPKKLQAFNITLEEIRTGLEKSNINTSGGFIESKYQEFLVRNLGRFYSLDDLKNTIVSYKNKFPIKIGDVADVKFGAKNKRGEGSHNGEKAVIMAISKQPNVSTIDLTSKIEEHINALKKSIPEDVEIDSNLFRQSNFIISAIHNVEEALRDGTIIVIIILFLFLLNFRITLIILTAIPLSFVITFLTLKLFGFSINTMTLGGLAVAIGELVDDSIVDIENIFRRLKENKKLVNPKPIMKVIYEASLEIRSSIIYATFIVVIAFIPLFFLSGIEGKLLIPLGISYIVSLLASLLVSLTLTPSLAYYLLPKAKVISEEKDSFFVQILKNADMKILNFSLENPKIIVTTTLVIFLLCLTSIPFIGKEFLPAFNEGTLTINVLAQPGISLTESDKIGRASELLIKQVPEVISTGRRTGRAELDEHAEGVHYSEIDVDLKKSNRSKEEILSDIRSKLSVIPNISSNIGQPISHRVDHLLSGIKAQIAIKLFGDDLQVLRSKADEIKNIVSGIQGATDVQVEKQVLIPQIQFVIDRKEALKYGISPATIAETLETSLNGNIVTEAIENQRRYEVVLKLKEEYHTDLKLLKNITIATPSGFQIPITAVAKISDFPAPNQILRENSKRRVVVMANTTKRSLGEVVNDIKKKIDVIKLPEGYFIQYDGQFEAQKEATYKLIVFSIFSTMCIFFLLLKALGNWAIALQIMINIPLAMIGAIFSILITKGNFSVATLVGFISLLGITSRNGIMMISHYMHLMEKENESFSKEMIIRGSLERLVPVLMTALTAGLSLIPLAISFGQSGKEILQPLTTVVLGGIISATLLDQLVTPTIFYHYGKNFLIQVKEKNLIN